MRITDAFRFQVYAANLSSLKEKMDHASNEVSLGKRVLLPSDDPGAFAQNIQITSEQSRNAQYASTLQTLQTQGSYYETSLNTISDVLTAVKSLAVQQASDTMDASSRSTAADQVDHYIQQLVAVGNTKVGDTYIFGGKQSGSVPFSLDSATNTVTFNGTTDVARVAVDTGSTTVEAGISGNTVFNGTVGGKSITIGGIEQANIDVFATLKQLSQDLRNNDTTALQTDIDNIDTCVDLTAGNLSYVGTYGKNISNLLTRNTTMDSNLTQTSSDLMDVDAAKAISDYNALSTAYQSALYIMAKVQGLTILNYM